MIVIDRLGNLVHIFKGNHSLGRARFSGVAAINITATNLPLVLPVTQYISVSNKSPRMAGEYRHDMAWRTTFATL